MFLKHDCASAHLHRYLSLTNALEAVVAVVGNTVQVLLIWNGTPCGFSFWNCEFVAWFVEFLGLASLLWASNIGFFFFLTFIRPIPGATVRKRTEVIFNVVAWGLPLAFTAVCACVPRACAPGYLRASVPEPVSARTARGRACCVIVSHDSCVA